MSMMTIAYLSLVGLALGSFAGCLAHRHGTGESVRVPARSYCPKCKTSLRWFENIPILSYCLLRGRCRSCGQPIGVRYLLIELAMLVGSVVLAFHFDSPVQWVLAMPVLFLLVVSAAVEAESGSVPAFAAPGVVMAGVGAWAVRGGMITQPLAIGFGVVIVLLSLGRHFCIVRRAPEGFWALMVATAFASGGYMDTTPVIPTAILASAVVIATLAACVKNLRKPAIPGSAILVCGFVAAVVWS